MTDPQLVVGYDPIIGDSITDPRYTLRVFYDPTITFGTEGRPWALCLGGGFFTGGGLPAVTLEETYTGHPELQVFVQRLYDAGVAVISMGYTITSSGITGGGAFDPKTWTRQGTIPNSFLGKDDTENATRSLQKDICNAIQRIRRTGLAVGLDTTNGRNGVVGVQAGSVAALFVALARDRSDPTAAPGTAFDTPTRPGWCVVVDPIVSFNAFTDATPIRHLTNDLGAVALTIGAAKSATNGTQNIRDASALWHGFNSTNVKTTVAVTPIYAIGRGAIEYTGSLAWADFSNVLTSTTAPEQTQALQTAMLALDVEQGTTYQADNSRFEVNPRLAEEDLGQDIYDWFEAVSGFSGGGPVEPPPTNVVDPTFSIGYDPTIGDALTDERYTINVFYRQDIAFPANNRPWLMVLLGGGFFPDSGLPLPSLNLSTGPAVWVELYNAGWAIVCPGYTVANDDPPNYGAFRPDDAFRRIGTGDTSWLVMDETKNAERCAEKDVCHVVQRIRVDGLGIGLDTTPGRGAIWGRSAGCSIGAFVAFGPERADPDAAPNSRYARSTRVGAFVCRQPVFAFNVYVDSVTQFHFINAAEDGYTQSTGEAKAANDAQVFKDQAALWSGFNLAATRQLNTQMPVYMVGQEAQTYFGPYTYDDMDGLLPDGHPPEPLLAMELELKAADTEFGTTTHTDVSVFETDAVSEEEISAGMLAVILNANPVQLVEPTSETILRNIESTLKAVKAGASYWTTLRDVRILDTAAVSDHLLPAALIRAYRTDMDGEGQTLTRAIRHSLMVSITLVVASRSTGARDMELLIRDAITALYVDRTRGGNAVHTIVEAVDRSYPDGDRQDTYVATLQVRVEFRTAHNNLASSI